MIADRCALIRERLASAGLRGQTSSPDIPRRANPERARLSHPQLHTWRYERANPGSLSNNLGLLLTFTGNVDELSLAGAVDRVADRHEVLRTTYHVGPDGAPFQRIHASLPFPKSITRANPDEATNRARLALHEPFNLETDAPLRLLMFRTGGDQVMLAIVFHHIVWDGVTFNVLSRDLEEAYAKPSLPLPALPFQYGDIAEWQRDQEDRVVVRELEYWTKRLIDPRPPHRSTKALGNVASNKEAAGRMDYRLTSSIALNRLASKNKVTPFVAFMACWATVLRKDGADEVTVGTTVLNRDQPGAEELVGNLANHIVLRLPVDVKPRSHALIAATAAEFDGAFAHRDLPYETLLDALGGQALDAPPRLFDSLVVFIPSGTVGPRLADTATQWRRLHNEATQFPLVPLGLEVFVRGRGDQRTIDIEATYARNAFDAEAVTELLVRLDKTIHDAAREAW